MSKVLISLLFLSCVALADLSISYKTVLIEAGKTVDLTPSACMCGLDHCTYTAHFSGLSKIVVENQNNTNTFALYVDNDKTDAEAAKLEVDLTSKTALPKFKIENKGTESLAFKSEVSVTGTDLDQKCDCTNCPTGSSARAVLASVVVILAMMLFVLV